MTAITNTIDIFEHLYNYVKDVLPNELREEMKGALESLKNDMSLNLEEVEDTIIVFGKKVWPYRKALEKFIALEEAHKGEKFLIGILSPQLKRRYNEFKACGGSLRDLHAGTPASFFTSEERNELCVALLEMNRALRQSAVQEVKGLEKTKFEYSCQEFEEIFERIEAEMDILEKMANEEQEHPHLAAEIRAHVRGFEHGFAMLGPDVRFDAVCNSRGHFEGRKSEIKILS